MTRVTITSATGSPLDTVLTIDGVDISRGVRSFHLGLDADTDKVPTLHVLLVPTELSIDMPGVVLDAMRETDHALAECWTAVRDATPAELDEAGIPSTTPMPASVIQQARLAALTEVHEFYEFDAHTEEQFDTWLHERIKAARTEVGAAGGPLDEFARGVRLLNPSHQGVGVPLSEFGKAAPERLLDTVSGKVARTVIEAMAVAWNAVPLGAQLAIMRYLRLASADEVLDAESDPTYAQTLIASAFNRALTYHAVDEFEAAIRSVRKGMKAAKDAHESVLVPGVNLVFHEHEPFESWERWRLNHPDKTIAKSDTGAREVPIDAMLEQASATPPNSEGGQ